MTGSATAGRSSSRTQGLHAGLHHRTGLWPASPTFAKRNTKMRSVSIDKIGDHQAGCGTSRTSPATTWTSDDRKFRPQGRQALQHAPGRCGETSDGHCTNNATVRTVYIIGPNKLVVMLIYPMSTGRNFDEVLRLLDSISRPPGNSVATPVNWKQGEECIIVPSLSDEDARARFPGGWKTVKPYCRTVPQPVDEPQPVD